MWDQMKGRKFNNRNGEAIPPLYSHKYVADLFGDEGRVDDNHVKCTPYILRDVFRLGEIVQYESGIFGPLRVQLGIERTNTGMGREGQAQG